MAQFVYHPAANCGGTKCYKIVCPNKETAWNFSTGALEQTISTTANGYSNLTFNQTLHGYAINLPAALPTGNYDILVFDGDASAISSSSVVECGIAAVYNASTKSCKKAAETASDRVA